MIDRREFSKVLKSFERNNKGWVTYEVSIPIVCIVNGEVIRNVLRANRKIGIVEVTITDSDGMVITNDGVIATKYLHGKVKILQAIPNSKQYG